MVYYGGSVNTKNYRSAFLLYTHNLPFCGSRRQRHVLDPCRLFLGVEQKKYVCRDLKQALPTTAAWAARDSEDNDSNPCCSDCSFDPVGAKQ